MVVDRPELDEEGYRSALLESMREQGYGFGGEVPLDEFVEDLVGAVQALGSVLGDGSVVERFGLQLRVRRAGR